MAIVSSYPNAENISVNDSLLGTHYKESGTQTRFFPISDILALIPPVTPLVSVAQQIKITLTPLQVQSLFTTPIKVIDCASGFAILPIQMLCVTDNPTTSYSPSGGQLALRYENLSTNILTCNTNLGSVGIGEAYNLSVTSITSGGFSRNGEDVYVRLLSANPVGGDGGMVLYIVYNIITI